MRQCFPRRRTTESSSSAFFLTAHFSQEDYPYDWLMHWLSKVCCAPSTAFFLVLMRFNQQPAWGRSREFDITTRSVSRHGLTQSTSGDLEEEEEEETEEVLTTGRRKRKGGSLFVSPDYYLLNPTHTKLRSSRALVSTFPVNRMTSADLPQQLIDTTHTIYYRGHWLRVRI